MKFDSEEDERKFVSSISCSICLEIYSSDVKPTVINCGHSMCIICTKSMISQQTKELECPLCRVKFKMDEKSIAPSYELLNMASLYTDSKKQNVVQQQQQQRPQTTRISAQPSAPQTPIGTPRPVYDEDKPTAKIYPKMIVTSQTAQAVQKCQAPLFHKITCTKGTKDEKYGFEFREIGKGHYTVAMIEPGSIAQDAGLLENDRILEINGKKVVDGVKFKDIINMVKKNQMEVEFVVMRGYVETELVYCIVEPPSSNAKAATAGFSIRDQKGRLYVTDVVVNTPAHRAGLHKGDQIVEVNQVDVTNKKFNEARSLMKWDDNNKPVLLIGVKRLRKK